MANQQDMDPVISDFIEPHRRRKLRSDTVEAYVALFAQHPGAGVETNARDEKEFVKLLSHEIATLLEKWPPNLGDREALLALWLEQAMDISCKLRGYKAEEVIESRVLYRGDLRPTDDRIVAVRGVRGPAAKVADAAE